MKRIVCALLALFVAALTAGCGSSEKADIVAVTSLSELQQEQQSDEPTQSDGALRDYASVDVDLTALSSTMVYSEVYNMMSYPSDYVGKTVKMRGQFSIYQAPDADGQPGQVYYACVIADATACCQQGMEFILEGDSGYPEPGEEITVAGEYRTYTEGDLLYCHLIDAQLLG